MGRARPSVEPLSAAPCRQRWPSAGVLLVPGTVGGSPPSRSCRGARSRQACGVSRAPSPYAHRCPQRRWPMLPATCAWPRTPRALWRSSLPSGCKVSCGEQATPGDSAAEQGPMLGARPNAGRHSTSSTPRATSLCLRCPRPWVCTQHLGILVWHQPPPGTESIWGTLITESQPQMILSDFGGLTASL